MDVPVRRRDLPGLGKQYEIDSAGGSRVAVVVQNNGARHLYTFDEGAETAATAVQLDEQQARTLGAVLAGVYFEPSGGNHDAPAVFGAVAIDWLVVEAGTPPMTVGDLGLADHASGMVVAVVSGDHTVMKPDAGEQVRAGDQLLIVGYRADIAEVRAKLLGAVEG
ncbi:K+/H+ antiporter YhaU, regulatory subunit KhtT [Lentzea fradiae]|uniref:K+/H+ antiporter YhaU, regulatory subunit KhtT n=1 Tax=Lentzea fradiae TaxID=200378 RepID=A0A1G7KVU1_9PSEU|nr:TrkA C-terminal domain-containing protein [Lentzea fradiae]SDF41194.1 K+/H+ antiporter YhaU, regulatory subunit KhtT [Lentzea fradiae]